MSTTMCMSCGRQHDSWRAYCTNCMQTQAIIKQMEASTRSIPFTSTVDNSKSYQSYQNYDYKNQSIINKILSKKIGTFLFFLWLFYMPISVLFGDTWTRWHFVTGFILFIWYSMEN
jgi:hypothetical protein